MENNHKAKMIESVGEETIQVLEELFRESDGSPPSVNAIRFRADHPSWMKLLDTITHESRFIEFDDSQKKTYRVSCYALPLLDSPKASQLLDTMEKLFLIFKEHYQISLNSPITVESILKGIDENKEIVITALSYMKDVSGWWTGLGADFPAGDSATVQVYEEVLLYENFHALINRYYEWNYINPKKQTSNILSTINSVTKQQVSLFFPQHSQAYPDWYESLDDAKKALIKEIEVSVNSKLSALPTMGLRTLIDTIITEHIGDVGRFQDKMKRFVEEGYITRQHSAMIDKVLDAGHASAHRAYFPNENDLLTCVKLVKHLMEGLYDLNPKLKGVAENTPKRPKS